MFEGIRDEKYLTKAFYERANSAPDFTIGQDALKEAKKRGLL